MWKLFMILVLFGGFRAWVVRPIAFLSMQQLQLHLGVGQYWSWSRCGVLDSFLRDNYFKQVTKNGQDGVMSSGFPGYSQASKLLRVFESWVVAHVLPSLKLFGKDWDKVYHTWTTLCYALLWLLWIRFNYGIRFLQMSLKGHPSSCKFSSNWCNSCACWCCYGI